MGESFGLGWVVVFHAQWLHQTVFFIGPGSIVVVNDIHLNTSQVGSATPVLMGVAAKVHNPVRFPFSNARTYGRVPIARGGVDDVVNGGVAKAIA